MVNSQDIEVSNFVKKKLGIKFSSVFLRSTIKEDWVHDKWSVGFTRDCKTEVFDYSTGIGHRMIKKYFHFTTKQKNRVKELRRLNGSPVVHFPLGNNEFAIAPTLANVLYCLLMGSLASDDSFNNWCDNYGYDNDSMKAFKTYQLCCDNGDKLKRIFRINEIKTLNELLQDY